MNLNIRLLICCCFFINLLAAQEEIENPGQYSEDPESVYFNLESFYPIGLGNSPYAEIYNFDPGYALDFNWFVKPKFTLGARYSFFRGYVEDKSKIGNISNTKFHLFGITRGYYQALDKNWNLHYKLGIGAVLNRHRAPEDHFSDEGGKTWASVEFSRRLDRTLGFFIKTGLDYEFLHINSSPEVESYLNSNFLVNLGLGIRIYFQNPGG